MGGNNLRSFPKVVKSNLRKIIKKKKKKERANVNDYNGQYLSSEPILNRRSLSLTRHPWMTGDVGIMEILTEF